jgi:hypothetical protein
MAPPRSDPDSPAAPDARPAPWRAIFVVGAGRSGTSALTRGVQALGVELGDRLKAPTEKNPTGFFEDVDLLRVAKAVRTRLGLVTESVALIEPERWDDAGLEPLCAECVETIRRRFGQHPLWGFKYAQTLRMLPFWQRVFERAALDVSYVVAARNPLSVARSRAKLDALRGVQEKSDAEWLVNVVPYFRQMAERPFVVVDYDLLMADPDGQLRRVARALDLPVDEATRERLRAYAETYLADGMRHTRFDDADLDRDPRLNPLTRDAYRWLRRLASDELTAESAALWKDWERIEQGVAGLAPLLRHVDRLEAELRGLRARPLAAARGQIARLFRRGVGSDSASGG